MNRLRNLERVMIACSVLMFAMLMNPAEARTPARPNIVIIMADDMGFSDIGCYGGEISTPHIDRLADEGLRFTQFYNTGRCCPTRAALLTGLYQHQAGIGHMVGDDELPSYRGFLNDRCVTIAEVLGQSGYRTYMSGKWHVGEQRPHWPVDRGFDRMFGLISGASSFWELDKGRQMAIDDRAFEPNAPGFYMTDAFSDHAVRFIENHAGSDKPYFLYLPYTAPHWPLHAWPGDIAKYKGKYLKGWDALRRERHRRMIEMGIVKAEWPITPRDESAPAWEDVENKAWLDLKMATYAAQIERMDAGIGRVMDAIRKTGEDDRTLVMFLADNGGCAENIDRRSKPGAPPGPRESYLSYGLPWANASNTPFRLYKHWVHEGGISAPLVVRWPAVISDGGKLTHQPGHLIDLMATCIDVANAKYPDTYKGQSITPLEGRSLLSIFLGREREEKPIFWEHEGHRAVRRGSWKLVAQNGAPWELYNLEDDRTELHDLASEEPDRVAELSALYDAWAERANVVPFGELMKHRSELRKKREQERPASDSGRDSQQARMESYMSGPLVIAHRGSSWDAPENTPAAYDLAIEMGAEMAECDVRLSKDGVPVLIHDETLKRTGGVEGKVGSLTLAELKKLDFGSWKHDRYRGERIPTLKETLERVKGKLRLVIEIKQPRIEKVVVTAIAEAGVAFEDVVIFSFDYETIKAIGELEPRLPTTWLINTPKDEAFDLDNVLRRAMEARVSALGGDHRHIDAANLRHAQQCGLAVYVWTVNQREEMERMIDLGVDAIITDRPDMLLDLYREVAQGK